jgi:hypothetical protein
MSYFLYQLHGLQIASEIELPEASGTEPQSGDQAEVDLIIRMGRVPREVRHFRAMAGEFEVGEGEVLLRVPGVGRFFMERGRMMTIEAGPGAAQHKFRIYVLGMAMGVILHQRGFLVLHGGACVVGEGAAGFIGYSGAGKSSTTSAFAARGYPFLTDDLMAIRFDADCHPEVCPGLPTVKLWPETADTLLPGQGAPFPQASLFKRRVHLPGMLASKPQRLSNLFVLSWLLPETAGPACDALEPMAGIATLRGHSFHPELVGPLGQDIAFLEQAARLIRSCPIWRLRRPRRLEAIEEIVAIATDRAGKSAHVSG